MNYDEPGMGRLAVAGATVGLCTAVLVTSIVALAQWLAGGQLSEVLNWALQLLLLLSALCSSLGALFALVYYTRRLMPLEPPEEEDIVYVDPYPAQQALEKENQTLAEQIVENAVQQATWHYADGKNPSRRAMEEEGVPQAIWNSARAVLREAGVLHGDEWADPDVAAERLKRVHPEDDKIWVPNKRGLKVLVVSDKLIGNSHIDTDSAPPH